MADILDSISMTMEIPAMRKKIHFMQIWDSFVLRSMEIITLTESIH